MRKIEMWMGAGFWALIAILMPMSALEPVQAAHAIERQKGATAAEACPNGDAPLAMGCESIHL